MKLIGIAGGVASGKSAVAEEFRRLGAEVLDADAVGHEVLRRPHIRQAVRQRWGEGVIGPDGEVHRPSLAKIVFEQTPAGAEHLKYLEKLTHPEIGRTLEYQASQMAAAGKVPAAILDAPVMFKAGWDGFCDEIVYVDAPQEVRLQRALQRGWTKEGFIAREAAQESLEEKRRRADWMIDNSGNLESTRNQVKRLWQTLIG